MTFTLGDEDTILRYIDLTSMNTLFLSDFKQYFSSGVKNEQNPYPTEL